MEPRGQKLVKVPSFGEIFVVKKEPGERIHTTIYNLWERDPSTCRLWEAQGSQGEQQDKAEDLP